MLKCLYQGNKEKKGRANIQGGGGLINGILFLFAGGWTYKWGGGGGGGYNRHFTVFK